MLARRPIASLLPLRNSKSPSTSTSCNTHEDCPFSQQIGRTFRKLEIVEVTWGLPNICRERGVETWRSANTRAIVAFTYTAALRPAFFSNFEEVVYSINWERVRVATEISCTGSSCAKSSIAAFTEAVAGGGGSGH